jgi:acyl-CoA synthetase (AMP-forming)/AMP-acid ligase II
MTEELLIQTTTPARTQPELFRPKLSYPSIPYDKLLTQSAACWPEHVAIAYHDRTLTFRELDALTNQLAHALQTLGVKQGERVCLLMANRPAFVISCYAIARMGAVFSPINPAYKAREIAYQLAHTEATAVVVQHELLPLVEAAQNQASSLKHVISVGPVGSRHESFAELIKGQPMTPPAVEMALSDLVALPASSGTTGLPKGVMLTHRNRVCNAVQFASAMRVSGADRFLIFLPLFHAFGMALLDCALSVGATAVLMERFNPGECVQLITQHRITVLPVVPPILMALLAWPDLHQYDLSSVRYVVSGAAPLPPSVVRAFQHLTGVGVRQAYGLTEVGPSHLSPVDTDDLNARASVGLPFSDTEQKVVDSETGVKELARGEVGELCLRGPQVMAGYWNAPEATASVLRDGWFYTGDIGFIDAHGYVYLQDRKKELIKYKGFSIAPAELEALLLEHPAVADAAVIGKPDEEAGEVPKAFVVRTAEYPHVTADELLQFAAARLARYKTLQEIAFIQAIPRSPSGKILRRVLKEQEEQKLHQRVSIFFQENPTLRSETASQGVLPTSAGER